MALKSLAAAWNGFGSYAAGLGLSLRRKDLSSRVFCIVGDGECDEGSIWESAAFIGHNQLSNVTVIVDQNRMQLDGPCASILDTGSIARKFDAFGFESVEVDGHDVLALYDALKQQLQGLARLLRTPSRARDSRLPRITSRSTMRA